MQSSCSTLPAPRTLNHFFRSTWWLLLVFFWKLSVDQPGREYVVCMIKLHSACSHRLLPQSFGVGPRRRTSVLTHATASSPRRNDTKRSSSLPKQTRLQSKAEALPFIPLTKTRKSKSASADVTPSKQLGLDRAAKFVTEYVSGVASRQAAGLALRYTAAIATATAGLHALTGNFSHAAMAGVITAAGTSFFACFDLQEKQSWACCPIAAICHAHTTCATHN